MENGWKMEDGKWKPENRIHHPCVLLGSRGEVRQASLPRSHLSNASHKRTSWSRTDGELALSIRDRSHVPNTTTLPSATEKIQDF
jgi:hypothetical protein